MICTALRAPVVDEYIALRAFMVCMTACFYASRAMRLEQSLTARTGATIVAYASQLGGYIQIGAGSPPGVS